jgi:hypothetical protein
MEYLIARKTMTALYYLLFETAATAPEDTGIFAAVMLPIVIVLGASAAIALGSIAWYNSKRPPGWEDKKRPDFVPKISQSGQSNSR